MKDAFLNYFKRLFPHSVRRFVKSLINNLSYQIVKRKQYKALVGLKDKKRIRCVFMAIDVSVWKYDEVVRLMMKNFRFEPIIFVCPMVNYGKEVMKEKMDQCMTYYESKGYKVVCSYNKEQQRYVDLVNELQPDILFYTNPYKGLIDDRYYIKNFTNILTVYVSYYISCSKDIDFCTNVPLYNIVWRKYVEFDFNLEICRKYANNGGRNVVVTGYPGIEPLIKRHANKSSLNVDNRKRIIWAPHHTLDASIYGHSCFFMYADFMLEMARKYENDIILIFKPHPLLKGKLYKVWGLERTEQYFNAWSSKSNTLINESDYIELFLKSDAMIHDSGSFVVEYLYVDKPVMRTVNDVPLDEQFNDFALSCLNQYYFAYNENDIEQFIQNVINGVDPLKEQRTKFVNDVLMPKGSPSQNIIDDILDSIDNQVLYRN